MMNTCMVECVFRVTADLRIGEDVRVSGSPPGLGSSDPTHAVRLVTSPSTYPWWTTKKSVFLSGEKGAVTYRYCVFSGGKFSRWEGEGKLFRDLDSYECDAQEGIGRVVNDVLDVPMSAVNSSASSPSSAAARVAVTSQWAPQVSSFRSRQFAAWGKRAGHKSQDVNITAQDRIVVVSYFLPVVLSKSSSGQWSIEWDNENILSLKVDSGNANITTDKINWVGTIGYNGAPVPPEEESAVSHLLLQMNCFPVFVNPTMHHQFYDVFCKQHLWMILHHVADVYGPLTDIGAKAQQELWFVYSTVNRMFRDKVVEVFQDSDLVWIHGFHLMLLPSFLRRVLTVAKIGIFFHTPFPSSEIWRTMHRREDLLRGVLAADQVGFHLYEYARHFLTTCHRLLGHGSDMTANGRMAINVDEREVDVTCIHVGIDLPRVNLALGKDKFKEGMLKWRSRFNGKCVIASIDRLERLKGIPLKLLAIDDFLRDNEYWRDKIVFSIIGITANERGDDYRLTLRDTKSMVNSINEKYCTDDSTCPIVHFQEQTDKEFRICQRLAYFAGADVLMVTPTRDGLNRLPLEFTLAKNKAGQLYSSGELGAYVPPIGAGPVNQGLMIVSEFISSARVMRGSVHVNPWYVEEVTKAIKKVLEMDNRQRSDRFRRNMEFSTRLTLQNWAIQVLNDLKAVEKEADKLSVMQVGFGMGFKVMEMKSDFKHADTKSITSAYRAARSRLIVLDWGGTLVADDDKTDHLRAYALATGQGTRQGPTQDLTDLLEKLCSDPKNTVFVVSGKELIAVSEYFGRVKHLGLGAEHGFYYRWPKDERRMENDVTRTGDQGQGRNGDANIHVKAKWQTLQEIGDQTWKESAMLIMKIFVQRTHGTYIEQKGNALIWQFRDADPEFGFLQSKELYAHLTEILAIHDKVEVIRGGGVSDGYIEVRPAGISKGLFLEHTLSTLEDLKRGATFVLCAGDDESDEPMFEQVQRSCSAAGSTIRGFGVTVGKKPSAATSFVDDPNGLMELLTALSRTSARDNKYYSVADLSSHMAGGATDFSPPKIDTTAMFNLGSPLSSPLAAWGGAVDPLRSRTAAFLDVKKPSGQTGAGGSLANRATSMLNLSTQNSITNNVFTGNMSRNASSAHLTMSSYLESINDEQEEEEDGLFF